MAGAFCVWTGRPCAREIIRIPRRGALGTQGHRGPGIFSAISYMVISSHVTLSRQGKSLVRC